MRQSFLPGFDGDVPFVLVDVELSDPFGIRLIGRLLDGPDADLPGRRPSASRSKISEQGVSVPAFVLAEPGER